LPHCEDSDRTKVRPLGDLLYVIVTPQRTAFRRAVAWCSSALYSEEDP